MADKPVKLLQERTAIESTLPRVVIVTQSKSALNTTFMKPVSAHHAEPDSLISSHLKSIAKNLSLEMYGQSDYIPFHDLYAVSGTKH